MTIRTRSFALMLATALVSAAAFWLLREHWGHVAGYARYLLFLACPRCTSSIDTEATIMPACPTRLSRRLDEALEDGIPAGDFPTLTEPAGDARDGQPCCCGTEKDPGAEFVRRSTEAATSCFGG